MIDIPRYTVQIASEASTQVLRPGWFIGFINKKIKTMSGTMENNGSATNKVWNEILA
jgi:hypothetical protein